MSSTHEAFVPGDVVCPVCGSGLAIRWKEPAAEPIRQDPAKTLTCLTIQGTVEAMEQEPYSSQRRIAWRGEEIIEALMDNPQFLRDIGLNE